MKTHITDAPAYDAGAYITEKLQTHKGQAILFLVSGGSSLDVLAHVAKKALSDDLTICTADERFTRDEAGNNFSKLSTTDFYESANASKAQIISTFPLQGETHENFALRIQNELEQFYMNHPNSYTIGLLGIGEDGHTAGIFPVGEEDFQKIYKNDLLYIQVTQTHLPFPFRTTITPMFIEEKIDDVVLYAVGSNKCDNILNYMHNKNFSQHQIPALIGAQHPESILFTDCATLI